MPLLENLPDEGWICVARLCPGGGFQHYFYDNLYTAQQQIDALDAQGHTVFLAQSTFVEPSSRKGENVQAVKSFWMDVDCGEGKPYASKTEAIESVKHFVAATDLPFPSVISSGNGLYLHWPLSNDIPPLQWKATARILKDTATAYKFESDPMRTADIASVLRPVGATHRKDSKNPKKVTLLRDCEKLDFHDFATRLALAAKKKQVNVQQLMPPKETRGVNDEFSVALTDYGPPPDADKIADKCFQIKIVRDTKGDVPEPLWYAAIGLLRHCKDGREVIHEWSKGHAEYDFSVTEAKINQHTMPPTSCQWFGGQNPSACVGCGYNGKIKSPIMLGRTIEEVPPQPDNASTTAVVIRDMPPTYPEGFKRTADGIVYEEDGVVLRVYPHDLYVTNLGYDITLGYEVVTVRHYLPHEGWAEIKFRSSLVHDPKSLLTTLHDMHVQVLGSPKERRLFVDFMEQFIAQLKRERKVDHLASQMGWYEDKVTQELSFVLGSNIYHKDGSTSSVGFAKNIPAMVAAFHARGDMHKWVDATAILNEPMMESYAFSHMVGCFGAPLMRFTGYAGAMVSMMGESGIGKTLIGKWVCSAYGECEKLVMLKDDTKNSLVSRLGVYNSLPLYIDELSNMENRELSDWAYKITQGRDRARLGKGGYAERDILNEWKTIALVSSNSSLIEKLASGKMDSAAEINRVFEYNMPRVATFTRKRATDDCHDVFMANYGEVGIEFVKELVRTQDDHRAKIKQLIELIDRMAESRPDERFWTALVAGAVYGGLIAKNLGLIKYDVNKLLTWAVKNITMNRCVKVESIVTDGISMLGNFLGDHSAAMLVMSSNDLGTGMYTIVVHPRSKLVATVDTHTNRLLINIDAIKRYFNHNHLSWNWCRDDLISKGVVLNPSAGRNLGKGTYYASASVRCIELDLAHPAMGGILTKLEVVPNDFRTV